MSAICSLVLAFVWVVIGLMGNSTPAKESIARAQPNPAVVELLGTPVQRGWFVLGSINLSNDTGHADLTLPIHGSRGKAEIHVIADKEFGRWTYQEMKVGSDSNNNTIDLLGGPAASQ